MNKEITLFKNFTWYILIVFVLTGIIQACGDINPEMEDKRTISLQMDYNSSSKTRGSEGLAAISANGYSTHLIIALPAWESISSDYTSFFSAFDYDIISPSETFVSLDIPLYTNLKIFAFLFKPSYEYSDLVNYRPIARYYGESTNFEIDSTTSSLSLGITLVDSPDADSTAPIIAEVTAIENPTTDNTPDYTFSSDEAGTITYGGSCSSTTISAISGDNTITFSSLSEGTYSDCTINVTDEEGNVSNTLSITSFQISSSSASIDTTAPILEEVTAITSTTSDNTPDYIFSSDEAGTITYGGSCSSSTSNVFATDNTITLSTLSDGTYSDCTIYVTDDSGNVSNTLTLTSFTVSTSTGSQMGGAIQGTELSLSTVVTTLAGTGSAGSSNGIGTSASINAIYSGITTDGTNLYVADYGNNLIRQIVISTGVVTTLAGSGVSSSADGTGTSASFRTPMGITTDGTNLYVAEYTGYKVRQVVISSGEVTTLAGTGSSGSSNGTGTAASFKLPWGITTDGTNLFVTEYNGHRVRQIVISSGEVTTLAGTGSAGLSDGIGTNASLNGPMGITTDGTNLYLVEYGNHIVRQIVISSGVVTTLAGSANQTGSTNGTGNAARFNRPMGITTDGTNLYIAGYNNHLIRKIVISSGLVTTIAGTGSAANPPSNGTGTLATFNYPGGVTSDGSDLYISDTFNYLIRKID